jgi:hypothetical protein
MPLPAVLHVISLHSPPPYSHIPKFFLKQAATHFFRDLAEHNEAQATSIHFQADMTGAGVVPHLTVYPTYGLVGTQSVSKFHTADAPLQHVRIYLINVRLQQFGTDLLLTLNLPPSAQAPTAADFGQALFIKVRVLKEGGCVGCTG